MPPKDDLAKIVDIVVGSTTGQELQCDYLVVGAGTAGMSFVDTIITKNPSATVVLVDRNSEPGGHWTNAYPFVQLHQPSCYYGVNSLCLGKNRNAKGNEMYDIHDRATGAEVLEYYKTVCEQFRASGRVTSFFDAEHKFDKKTETHTIVVTTSSTNHPVAIGDDNAINSNSNGNSNSNVFNVKCTKFVSVATDVTVPSMREPLIPVHERVSFVPVNDVPSSVTSGKYSNYIVFGNGKTGVDAIIQLLDHGIDQSKITWVVSRDVWYLLRDAMADFYKVLPTFCKMASENSVKECFLMFEENGLVGRLDPKGPHPEVFKGATIYAKELDLIRSIQNVVRMGRATSIEPNKIVLDRGSLEFSSDDTLLVDCMVDNLYGYRFSDDFAIFEPGRINLGPMLGVFNPSLSSAIIAFWECTMDGDDDESKNDCCYFLRGEYSDERAEMLIGGFYMEVKSNEALMKVKGGTKFLMNCRTNLNSPMHHKGGMLRLMWNFYGPQQLHKFGKALVEKVESKGYSDVNHCFGIETLVGNQKKPKKSDRAAARWTTRCFRSFPFSRRHVSSSTTTPVS